jgi:preprotein translocase subunit YajC
MDALVAALVTSGNIAIIALTITVFILYSLLQDRNKAAQEDRKEMIASLAALTEVLTQLRIQLAESGRK